MCLSSRFGRISAPFRCPSSPHKTHFVGLLRGPHLGAYGFFPSVHYKRCTHSLPLRRLTAQIFDLAAGRGTPAVGGGICGANDGEVSCLPLEGKADGPMWASGRTVTTASHR